MDTHIPSSTGSVTLSVTASKYMPIAELGRGGMATAYLAAAQGPGGFNKLVVVKRLRPSLAAEPEFLKMFLDEARLSARIDHPNVVHTTDVGFDGEHHYIAMEFLDGQSLEGAFRRLAKRRAAGAPANAPAKSAPVAKSATESAPGGEYEMPLKLHLHVLSLVLAGLDFAHELKDFDGEPLNVVHRDVSPHNVMVTYEGQVKLLDFGIAKAADSSSDTRTGVMKGKCAYMPAEQFGGKNIDRRADVFAVGVMLWQALAGRKLWRGLSDAEIFAHVAKGEVPKPSSVNDGVPRELEDMCMKALSVRPSDRFETAAEFQAAIDGYVASRPDLRATSKELGKFVADLFSDERVKLKAIIESQLGKVARRTSVPILTNAVTTSSSPSGVVPKLDELPAPRRSGRILVLGALALVALGALLFVARSRVVPSTTTVSTGAPTADVACTVTIRASPAEARIFFDDGLLEGNPAISTFRRDGVKHRVRADAPGYASKTEWLTLEGGQVSLDLALESARATAPLVADKPVKPNEGAKEPRRGPVWWPPPKPTAVSTGNAGNAPTPIAPTATSAPAATAPTQTPKSNAGGPDLDKTDPWATPGKK